jgi:hypothetical protein
LSPDFTVVLILDEHADSAAATPSRRSGPNP